MFGILGESGSDARTLTVLVRRIARDERLAVKYKGFKGGPDMCSKGQAWIREFRRAGSSRFIVCHDADGPDPAPKAELVRRQIVKPAGVGSAACIVVPVQEIEAWILADLERAAQAVFTGWPVQAENRPEHIRKPKEHLQRLSRGANGKPRYDPSTHNEQLAKHLDLDVVAHKCPSFRPLRDFVQASLSALA